MRENATVSTVRAALCMPTFGLAPRTAASGCGWVFLCLNLLCAVSAAVRP